MAYPMSLSGLSTREEITDTLVRACLGLDSNNKALWESAWAADPDISMEINGNVTKGLENLNKSCFDLVGPMDTQHLVSSVRIDVKEGGNTAHVTANALNQHYRAGQGKVPNAENLLAGSVYDVQVVKEADGQWKLKTWVLNVTWAQGSWAVLHGE